MKKTMILAALIVLSILCVMLTGCSARTEVELTPYISVHYQGNEGDATAVFDFDYAGFEYAVMSQWERDGDNLAKLADLTALELTMNCEPASVEQLSNGDVIQVTITYDQALAKELGYVLQDTGRTFVVEGLQEAILLDPFDPEYFSVSLSGCSPKVSVTVGNTAGRDDPLRHVQYSLDRDGDLCNGDSVTVTASFMPGYNMDAYALSRTEMVLTIEDMDCYLTDLTTLTPAEVQAIQEKALEAYSGVTYLDIVCENGGLVSFTGENLRRATAPEFSGRGYTVLTSSWGTECTLLMPFRMFADDAEFTWWNGVYQDPVLVQDMELYGCFLISGLRQTASGDLIREGAFSIQLLDLYQSQDALEQAIRAAYSGEALTEGAFRN